MSSDKCSNTESSQSTEGIAVGSQNELSHDVIVEFDKVTKIYHLYKSDRRRLLGVFSRKRKPQGYQAQAEQQNESLEIFNTNNGFYLGSIRANNELSFTIRRGEAVAFLGQNGAGKTTALKIITGVAHPTTGRVRVNGRVSALLDLQAGFDSQLTGRENINMRAHILGLDRKEIKVLEEKAIEFAELGIFIDQPIRTYSSGMKARLGFAFAVSMDPEILVVDETLSVGDKRFREKCIERMREIMLDESVTVLFVTHVTETARKFCTRGIVLNKGKKVFDGPIDEAIEYYDLI